MLKKLIIGLLGFFVLTSNVLAEETNLNQEKLIEALKDENMIQPFGGLNWKTSSLQTTINKIQELGVKIEIISGVCGYVNDYESNFHNLKGFENEEQTKLFNAVKNQKCTFVVQKGMKDSDILKKISDIDRKLKKIIASSYKDVYGQEDWNRQTGTFYINSTTNKSEKFARISNNLIIKASPIVISTLPFELNVFYDFNPAISLNKEIKIYKDQDGFTYPYVISNVKLISENKRIKDNYNNILQILNEKYSKYAIRSTDSRIIPSEFIDSLGNSLKITKDFNRQTYIEFLAIEYTSALSPFMLQLYTQQLAQEAKLKDEKNYINSKDSKDKF